MDEREKLREEWMERSREREYRASTEWPQNGDWDRSCSSYGDATLHREREKRKRERECVKEK